LNKKSICIVTDELMGIPPSGGIGTATLFLATTLARSDFRVKILYVNPRITRESAAVTQRKFLKNNRINIDFLDHILYENWYPDYLRRSKAVYEYFLNSEESFDIVLFHELWHDGYLCLKNKGGMPCFSKSLIGVICHSPYQWIVELHGKNLIHDYVIHSDFERACIGMADFLISPSQYLIDWFNQKGWKLPASVYIVPYAMEPINGWAIPDLNEKIFTAKLNEIVFCGRLEERKGIFLFLEALGLIPKTILKNKILTFLGRAVIPQSEIQQKICDLNLPLNKIQFLCFDEYDLVRAYLKDRSRLVVLPSAGETFGCVVCECIMDRAAFLSSRNGGQSELIHPDHHNECLFEYNSGALSKKLEMLFCNPTYTIPGPSPFLRNAVSTNVDLYNKLAETAENQQFNHNITTNNTLPIISIIIIGIKSQENLFKVVKSAVLQLYDNKEVIVLLDQFISPDFEVFIEDLATKYPIVRIIRDVEKEYENCFNFCASEASGDYIFFLNDNCYLYPDCINQCVLHIMSGNEDCLIPSLQYVSEDMNNVSSWISVGGGLRGELMTLCLTENLYGHGCFFVKKSICIDHPFPINIQNLSVCNDIIWPYLLHLHLSEVQLTPYPQCLIYYNDPDFSHYSHSLYCGSEPFTYSNYRLIASVIENHGMSNHALLSELYNFSENPDRTLIRKRLEQENLELREQKCSLEQDNHVLLEQKCSLEQENLELREQKCLLEHKKPTIKVENLFENSTNRNVGLSLSQNCVQVSKIKGFFSLTKIIKKYSPTHNDYSQVLDRIKKINNSQISPSSSPQFQNRILRIFEEFSHNKGDVILIGSHAVDLATQLAFLCHEQGRFFFIADLNQENIMKSKTFLSFLGLDHNISYQNSSLQEFISSEIFPQKIFIIVVDPNIQTDNIYNITEGINMIYNSCHFVLFHDYSLRIPDSPGITVDSLLQNFFNPSLFEMIGLLSKDADQYLPKDHIYGNKLPYFEGYEGVLIDFHQPLLSSRFKKRAGRETFSLINLKQGIITHIRGVSHHHTNEINIIKKSPFFNSEWYVQQLYNLDIQDIEPENHYFYYGWKMGLDPSPIFCTSQYLQRYPDVYIAGVNPLVHYELHGKWEGRIAGDP